MRPPIAALVDRAHGHRAPGTARMRRIVLRMPAGDVARVDALRSRFKVPRADLLRAFVLFGLATAEEQPITAPTPALTTPEAATTTARGPVLHVVSEGHGWEWWTVDGPGAEGVRVQLDFAHDASGQCRYFISRERRGGFTTEAEQATVTDDSGLHSELPPTVAAVDRDRREWQKDVERQEAAGKRWSMAEKRGTFTLDGWDDTGVRGTLTAILKDFFGDVEVTVEPTRRRP